MEEGYKYSGEQGFKIPDNYFGEMEENVIRRLDLKEKISEQSDRRKLSFYYWPIAASIILGGFAWLTFKPGKGNSESFYQAIQSLDSSELNQYVYTAELEDEEFIYLIPETLVDSLYETEISGSPANIIQEADLEYLEEEYSALDLDTDI